MAATSQHPSDDSDDIVEVARKRARVVDHAPHFALTQNPVLIRGPRYATPDNERAFTRDLAALIEGHDMLELVLLTTYNIDLPYVIDHLGHSLTHKSAGRRAVHLISNDCATLEACAAVRSAILRLLDARFQSSPERAIELYVHPRPSLDQWGTFHPKLGLLFYPHGARVIVHTCNLDGPNALHESELYWHQDFPAQRAADASAPGRAAGNDFLPVLADFVEHMMAPSVAHGFVHRLRALDFSLAEVRLVASRPKQGATGFVAFQGAELSRFGLGRLTALAASERVPPAWPCVVQVSSFGSQNSRAGRSHLHSELGRAMLGGGQHDPALLKVVMATEAEFFSMRATTAASAGSSSLFGNFNLYDPRSAGGQRGAPRGDVWTWTPPPEANTSRGYACPHCKTLVRFDPAHPERLAWVYMGSANASQTAWGAWTSQKRDKLRVLSFELGVFLSAKVYAAAGPQRYNVVRDAMETVFPPCEGALADRLRLVTLGGGAGPFDVVVPLPFALPGRAYDARDRLWGNGEPRGHGGHGGHGG